MGQGRHDPDRRRQLVHRGSPLGVLGNLVLVGGWQPNQPTNWLQYGGVYPIHSGGKIANVAFGDGHAKVLSVGAMLRGVSLNASMQVTGVYDQGLYIWDREA